ncbi:MAG: hypothetical protein KGI06_05715, partial [Candidatus Micrarchaeota archaeon]|nr:hypothetical protein [Candidatus Micrarchaeota archaeon]
TRLDSLNPISVNTLYFDSLLLLVIMVYDQPNQRRKTLWFGLRLEEFYRAAQETDFPEIA